MNIFEMFQFVNYRANKEQSGRTYTQLNFNLACKAVGIDYFKLKTGIPEEYLPGKPFPRQAWQITDKITADCMHLIVEMGGRDFPLMVVDKNGFADVPADFAAYSSLTYMRSNNDGCGTSEETVDIEVVFDAIWSGRHRDSNKYPDKEFPIARFRNGYLQFAPKDLQFVNFVYLKTPIDPYLAITIDDNNNMVYDATNSIQFEWPVTTHTDICNMLLEWLGENIKDPGIIQMAQQRKTAGI